MDSLDPHKTIKKNNIDSYYTEFVVYTCTVVPDRIIGNLKFFETERCQCVF